MAVIGLHNPRKTPVAIGDRLRHLYIIGQTGTGKSSLLRLLMCQDQAFAFLDPHGELAEELLDFIPANRAGNVIYFNPKDTEFPIGFNPLEGENQSLIVDSIIYSFKSIWGDSWGPRMEYAFSNCLLALTESKGSNLLWVNRFLTNKSFRADVLYRVRNNAVLEYWENFDKLPKREQAEITGPIQNKVGRFTTDPIMSNIFSQPNKLDFTDIMDTGKTFIANLSKGHIGHINSQLLGSLITSRFEIAAMERKNKTPFNLYLDEFANFTTDSFESMLSESRKYGLGLTLAHQYIDQLPLGLQRAVFGNVGTFIILRVGYKDASYLAQEFDLPASRFAELSRFRAIVKTLHNGEPFDVGEVALARDVEYFGAKQTLINQSREIYGKDRQFVERKVGEFYGVSSGLLRASDAVLPPRAPKQ